MALKKKTKRPPLLDTRAVVPVTPPYGEEDSLDFTDTRRARQERSLLEPPNGTPRQVTTETQLERPKAPSIVTGGGKKAPGVAQVAPTSRVPMGDTTDAEAEPTEEGGVEQEIIGILGKAPSLAAGGIHALGFSAAIYADNAAFLRKVAATNNGSAFLSAERIALLSPEQKARYQTLLGKFGTPGIAPTAEETELYGPKAQQVAEERVAAEKFHPKAQVEEKKQTPPATYDLQFPSIPGFVRSGDADADLRQINYLNKQWEDWLVANRPQEPLIDAEPTADGIWIKADSTPADPRDIEAKKAYIAAAEKFEWMSSLVAANQSMLAEQRKIVGEQFDVDRQKLSPFEKARVDAEIRGLDLQERQVALDSKRFSFEVLFAFLQNPASLSALSANPQLFGALKEATGLNLDFLTKLRKSETDVMERVQALLPTLRGKSEGERLSAILKLAGEVFWTPEELKALMDRMLPPTGRPTSSGLSYTGGV